MLALQMTLVLATIAEATTKILSGNVTVPQNLTFYTPSWSGWDEHITRWSAYEAPTFALAVMPKTKEELSQEVNSHYCPPY